MKTKTDCAIDGFSVINMKRELQERFQKQTKGMTFVELHCFLDNLLLGGSRSEKTNTQVKDWEKNDCEKDENSTI